MREQLLGPEQRRRNAPLPAPIVAFGDQQPLAARAAQHVIVERPFGVALAVVEQDLLDQLRIHDEDDLEAERAVDHDWLVIEVLGPARDRIGKHARDQQGEGKPPFGRLRHLDYGRV